MRGFGVMIGIYLLCFIGVSALLLGIAGIMWMLLWIGGPLLLSGAGLATLALVITASIMRNR